MHTSKIKKQNTNFKISSQVKCFHVFFLFHPGMKFHPLLERMLHIFGYFHVFPNCCIKIDSIRTCKKTLEIRVKLCQKPGNNLEKIF